MRDMSVVNLHGLLSYRCIDMQEASTQVKHSKARNKSVHHKSSHVEIVVQEWLERPLIKTKNSADLQIVSCTETNEKIYIWPLIDLKSFVILRKL